MKHPYDRSYSFGPGPDAVERRMRAVRAAERPDYAAMTDALWKQAWGPVQAPGNGFLTAAFNASDNYRAGTFK